MATGLTSLSQQIAVTIGIPIFGAIAATHVDLIDGVHLVMRGQLIAIVLAVALVWIGLRPPATPRRTVEPAPASGAMKGAR